jgi:uncharacterized protein
VKFERETRAGVNLFTGYGDGYVLINGARHARSLIVAPERVIEWEAASFEALREEHFGVLAALAPEIVLLGTGPRLRFPHPRLTASLSSARIGLEVMDLNAACRTYNILVSEDRRVAAALLFE